MGLFRYIGFCIINLEAKWATMSTACDWMVSTSVGDAMLRCGAVDKTERWSGLIGYFCAASRALSSFAVWFTT